MVNGVGDATYATAISAGNVLRESVKEREYPFPTAGSYRRSLLVTVRFALMIGKID